MGLLKDPGEGLGRSLAGGGKLVGFNEFFVKFPVGDGDAVHIFLIPEMDGQRHHGKALPDGLGQVCGGIHDNSDAHNSVSLIMALPGASFESPSALMVCRFAAIRSRAA